MLRSNFTAWVRRRCDVVALEGASITAGDLWPDLCVGCVLAFSALAWGSVHTGTRLVLTLIIAAAGLALGMNRGIGKNWRVIALALCVMTAGLFALPVPIEVRSIAQPGVIGILGQAAGNDWYPLGLAPRGAALGWAWVCALVVFGHTVHRTRLRPTTVPLAVGAAGLAVLIWAVLSWSEPGFGPYRNPNHASVFLVVGAVLCAGRVAALRQWGWGALAAVLMLGALATGSRAAPLIGLLGLGTVVALRLRPPRWLIALVAVATLSVVSLSPWWFPAYSEWVDPGSTYHGVVSGRAGLIGDAWTGIVAAPGGIGLGGFEAYYPVIKSTPNWVRAAHVHQDLVQGILEFGVLPMAIAAVALGTWLWSQRRVRAPGVWGALVVVAAAAMAGFPLQMASLALLAAMVLASLSDGHAPQAGRSGWWSVVLILPIAVAIWVFVQPPERVFGPRVEVASLSDGRVSCAQARAAHPLDSRALLHCAVRQKGKARLSGIDAALSVDPTHPLIWWMKGRVHRAEGEAELAAAAFSRALVLDLPPGRPAAEWLREAFADRSTADQVFEVVRQGRPDRLCEALEAVPDVDTRGPVMAGEAPRCAVAWAQRLRQSGRANESLTWLESVPMGCGRQRVGAAALLDLGQPAAALDWLAAPGGACVKGDQEVRRIRSAAREQLGINATGPRR